MRPLAWWRRSAETLPYTVEFRTLVYNRLIGRPNFGPRTGLSRGRLFSEDRSADGLHSKEHCARAFSRVLSMPVCSYAYARKSGANTARGIVGFVDFGIKVTAASLSDFFGPLSIVNAQEATGSVGNWTREADLAICVVAPVLASIHRPCEIKGSSNLVSHKGKNFTTDFTQ